MKNFEWSESYSIYNPSIDTEHKIFIKLINKLISAHNNDLDDYYCGRLSLEIQKYAEFHFVSEENFMIDINYPLLEDHQKQHIIILEKFNVEMNYIELGQRNYVEFIEFLVGWLTEHTLMQDKKIGDFIKDNRFIVGSQ